MLIHCSTQEVCNIQFLVVKLVREIYQNEEETEALIHDLESEYGMPVYLLCEESEEKTTGEIEWIRGYINLYESRFEFEILELNHGTHTQSYH